jgi:hypothetical protein
LRDVIARAERIAIGLDEREQAFALVVVKIRPHGVAEPCG